jgi:hypothetical protein
LFKNLIMMINLSNYLKIKIIKLKNNNKLLPKLFINKIIIKLFINSKNKLILLKKKLFSYNLIIIIISIKIIKINKVKKLIKISILLASYHLKRKKKFNNSM